MECQWGIGEGNGTQSVEAGYVCIVQRRLVEAPGAVGGTDIIVLTQDLDATRAAPDPMHLSAIIRPYAKLFFEPLSLALPVDAHANWTSSTSSDDPSYAQSDAFPPRCSYSGSVTKHRSRYAGHPVPTSTSIHP